MSEKYCFYDGEFVVCFWHDPKEEECSIHPQWEGCAYAQNLDIEGEYVRMDKYTALTQENAELRRALKEIYECGSIKQVRILCARELMKSIARALLVQGAKEPPEIIACEALEGKG